MGHLGAEQCGACERGDQGRCGGAGFAVAAPGRGPAPCQGRQCGPGPGPVGRFGVQVLVGLHSPVRAVGGAQRTRRQSLAQGQQTGPYFVGGGAQAVAVRAGRQPGGEVFEALLAGAGHPVQEAA